MAFNHLHVHTAYSVGDAISQIPELVGRAKELGMKALAITDHGNLYGVKEFYEQCKMKNIKPIIGCEVYIEDAVKKGKLYHLIMLAENERGFCNLAILIHKSQEYIVNRKPALRIGDLTYRVDGIIALSGCLGGEISKKILEVSYEDALASAYNYKQIFRPGCFFIEINSHHKYMHHKKVNPFFPAKKAKTQILVPAFKAISFNYPST